MTFLELQSLVSYYVDDLNFGYFTPIQVKRFINNAAYEVQKLLVAAGQNWYLKCSETTLVVSQRDYILPDDFLDLNRLVIVVSGTPPNETLSRVHPITVNQEDLMLQQPGTPISYYLKKNRLIVLPAPDLALTLRLFYTYRVAEMVLDAEVPDVPTEYQEFIAVLAAQDCLIKDGRMSETLSEKKAMYKEMLKNSAAERTVDKPRQVVVTNGSSYSGYGGYY